METGSHGDYHWLSTHAFGLDNLLQKCPQAFVGKFIAVTSLDSGSLIPTPEQKDAGWQSNGGIAYSPKIVSTASLTVGGFDEWYIFASPARLGDLVQDNPFEKGTARGHVFAFVNYGDFGLHNAELRDVATLFWKQFDWIQPESYVADGNAFLTFVTRDKSLFSTVRDALTD